MNTTEAKLIVLISELEAPNRNVFYLAAKTGKCFSATYNYLRVLEALGLISKSKRGKSVYFSLRDQSIKEKAEKILLEAH